jgi:uncharacterized RDD family membrane protein YckC
MNDEPKMVFGWTLFGMLLPIVAGGILIDVVQPHPVAFASALLVSGAWMAVAGSRTYKRARTMWGVGLRDAFRIGNLSGPTFFHGRFLAVTATLASCGALMAVVGIVLGIGHVARQVF